MVAHPNALDKLKDLDLDNAIPFNRSLCEAADEMTNASSQVNASSIELSNQAEKLNIMVKQFSV